MFCSESTGICRIINQGYTVSRMREIDLRNRSTMELCETVPQVIRHGTMLVHMSENRSRKCKDGRRTTGQGPLPLNATHGTATTPGECHELAHHVATPLFVLVAPRIPLLSLTSEPECAGIEVNRKVSIPQHPKFCS